MLRLFYNLFDKLTLTKKFHHEVQSFSPTRLWSARSLVCAQGNIEKNALNKSPSLRADFPKFDQIPDNLRFIEALIGLD